MDQAVHLLPQAAPSCRDGTEEIQAFLSDLVVRGNVSASTQNQALCALIFLYRLLGKDIGVLGDVVRAKRPRRLPVVLTEEEVDQVFACLEGLVLLICRLLYGSLFSASGFHGVPF